MIRLWDGREQPSHLDSLELRILGSGDSVSDVEVKLEVVANARASPRKLWKKSTCKTTSGQICL